MGQKFFDCISFLTCSDPTFFFIVEGQREERSQGHFHCCHEVWLHFTQWVQNYCRYFSLSLRWKNHFRQITCLTRATSMFISPTSFTLPWLHSQCNPAEYEQELSLVMPVLWMLCEGWTSFNITEEFWTSLLRSTRKEVKKHLLCKKNS